MALGDASEQSGRLASPAVTPPQSEAAPAPADQRPAPTGRNGQPPRVAIFIEPSPFSHVRMYPMLCSAHDVYNVHFSNPVDAEHGALRTHLQAAAVLWTYWPDTRDDTRLCS